MKMPRMAVSMGITGLSKNLLQMPCEGGMPALRFKTCRLLEGNVWNRELTIIQRRILRRLRNKTRSNPASPYKFTPISHSYSPQLQLQLHIQPLFPFSIFKSYLLCVFPDAEINPITPLLPLMRPPPTSQQLHHHYSLIVNLYHYYRCLWKLSSS